MNHPGEFHARKAPTAGHLLTPDARNNPLFFSGVNKKVITCAWLALEESLVLQEVEPGERWSKTPNDHFLSR